MVKDFLEIMKESESFGPNLQEQAKNIADFNSKLTRFMELISNKAGHSQHKRAYLMKEAETTSDFPILFGTVLDRQLRARYKAQTADWRAYVKAGQQNDFRKSNLLTVWGLESQLTQVDQEGAYPSGKIVEGNKVEIALTKFGRQFGLAWETLINDDLGAFSDLAARLAKAAVVTESFQATKLFVGSGGPASPFFTSGSFAHPIDGASVVGGNKGTTALSADAIGDVISAMTSQLDADGNPILISRFHLVAPPKKYITALKALSDAALIATGVGASAATQTSANVIAKLPITLHMNPYLPAIDTTHGDTSWYMFADPAEDGVAVQLNFLAGHTSPEVVQKAADKLSLGGGAVAQTEGDFESDTARWRARHVMGGATVDPRMAYAQAATT